MGKRVDPDASRLTLLDPVPVVVADEQVDAQVLRGGNFNRRAPEDTTWPGRGSP